MHSMAFDKRERFFQILFIILFQLTNTICPFNLYNTDQRSRQNSLQYDCLTYHTYHEKLAYQELSDVVDEIIQYCFRPESIIDVPLIETLADPLAQNISFEELRLGNITAQQLLLWSISIEVAERYQYYLNEKNNSLNEYIYNCTKPYFGVYCQYWFKLGEGMSFAQIVEADFRSRTGFSDSTDMTVPNPCYILLKCHRNGQTWCLDWREICDGKVDCFDESLDEEFCFDMELNECLEDEYRCHNGLCISEDLWENGVGDPDCLDQSDTGIEFLNGNTCFQDPTFRCEEHSCRPNDHLFSCGDGQCLVTFYKCNNGRHELLRESLAVKGNLTDACWHAMICLTYLVKEGNEDVCDIRFTNRTIYAALKQCGSFFQFPTTPVYSDHIRFFYQDPYLKSNLNEFLLPDYICYDQELCDCIASDLVHEKFICIKKPETILIWDSDENPWTQLLSLTKLYFGSCSFNNITYRNKTSFNNYSSLYRCQNSSKLISKHRIMDGMEDCFEEDDENYRNSCMLNDRFRTHCYEATECWSPLIKNEVCQLGTVYTSQDISFQNFCDGIKQYFYDDNKDQHSDEFGCGDWSCNNMYTRCDGFWTCIDGRDENECGRNLCPSEYYACVSSINYTAICLPFTLVNDGITHCLGALDEQIDCRSSRLSKERAYIFRCSDGGKCLQLSQLCDNQTQCTTDDDEAFCQNQQFNCVESPAYNRTNVEEIICGLDETINRRIKYFSVHTSTNYPSAEKDATTEFVYKPTEQHRMENANLSQLSDNPWPWYCNRGLLVRVGNDYNDNNSGCICPPSYYGRSCQYQNQRVSLSLRLASDDRHATYSIIIMLINEDKQEIETHDQFVYIVKESCTMKLNRYLLFSARPKNVSSMYHVRIDIFEKNTFTYIGSWNFPIDFLFLPVNRLGISLNVSNHQLERSFNCSVTCKNGECIRYVNKNKWFCRCFPQWSGIDCDRPIQCQTCSSDSMCVGLSSNQSICVCPIGKFGKQCLLTSTCPINACQHNGQCIPADLNIPGSNYTCICTDRYFGRNCEYQKATLTVSFNRMSIPSYLVAYFFTLSNQSEPIQTTILRKLSLFQHTVTFHIAVPYQLTFIQTNGKYYLAALQQSPKLSISTAISPKQECISVSRLFNSTVLNMIPYRRIIHFHYLCQTNYRLTCFIDPAYLCLCTNDHHANCLEFHGERNFQCPTNNYCENDGYCLQDHPNCPSTKICLCPDCYFGNRCQFYAKALGSTLDEILGYEIKRNTYIFKQSAIVQLAAIITMILFIAGIVNSIVSLMIFTREKTQEVGCGIYIMASSITSLVIMILLVLKFWLLFFSYQYDYGHPKQQRIFQASCYIELLLKAALYLDSWLNALVSIERTVSTCQGVSFKKSRSRQIACWVLGVLCLTMSGLFIPQVLYMDVYNDPLEERSWCVIEITPWLRIYSIILLIIHYLGPLSITIIAAIVLIERTTHYRKIAQPEHSWRFHLKTRIIHYKHILISFGIIICLTLPHLVISMVLDCKKSSILIWIYLIGYSLAFLPSVFVCVIYVVPSPLYKEEFRHLRTQINRRWQRFILNSTELQ